MAGGSNERNWLAGICGRLGWAEWTGGLVVEGMDGNGGGLDEGWLGLDWENRDRTGGKLRLI